MMQLIYDQLNVCKAIKVIDEQPAELTGVLMARTHHALELHPYALGVSSSSRKLCLLVTLSLQLQLLR